MDEWLALAYAAERNAEVIIVRFFNTVGPRQTGRYGMVLPNFARQALLNERWERRYLGQVFKSVAPLFSAVRGLNALAVAEVLSPQTLFGSLKEGPELYQLRLCLGRPQTHNFQYRSVEPQ